MSTKEQVASGLDLAQSDAARDGGVGAMTSRRAGPVERPIPFSAAEVRAILAGQKTQTRRLLKLPEGHSFDHLLRTSINLDNAPPYGLYTQTLKDGTNQGTWIRCPYSDGSQGDRLWVREPWRLEAVGVPPSTRCRTVRVAYTDEFRDIAVPAGETVPMGAFGQRMRGGSRLPRWASRLTLEITAVRAERLQAITEADARAEGIASLTVQTGPLALVGRPWASEYARPWDEINGKRATWASNPWVWVVEFRCVAGDGSGVFPARRR